MKVLTTTEAHDQQQLLETAEYTTVKFLEHVANSDTTKRLHQAMDDTAAALPSWGAAGRLIGLLLVVAVLFLLVRPYLRAWRRQKNIHAH